jgi:hypothetical protein
MPTPHYRVLVTVPFDGNLNAAQREIKERILHHLAQAGFEAQITGELGSVAANTSWTFDDPRNVLRVCQGLVILGLARWDLIDHDNRVVKMISEYSHYEGAVAIERNLPTLHIAEDGVLWRGILHSGGGKFIIAMPRDADAAWIDSDAFQQRFKMWVDQASERYHVFVGYSGAAAATAKAIIEFLRSNDVRVMDWQDFQSGSTIFEEIERADSTCMGGIFLFTNDDELVSVGGAKAAPRDNVIFEAGYFMNSKGKERVLIIREKGAKMPADVGGNIYLDLDDRSDIAPIEQALLKFIQERF